MFDKIERKPIENMGLNCLYIDNQNKDCLLKDLDYIDKSIFDKNIKVINSKLLSKENFESFGINPCVLPILIVDPRYFNDIYIRIMQKYKVPSLILNSTMTTFLKKPTADEKVLKNISFIQELPFLKQFYLQPQRDMIFTKFWDIDDFSFLEEHQELECLYLPVNDIFIDIDFSTIPTLKDINLTFPKNNKTLYECPNIELVDTRYYEPDLSLALKWKRLKKFSAYFDKLKSFEGIEKFEYLEEFKGEYTSSLQTLNGLNSKSIKVFYFYTEARKTLMTLQGVSGLKNVEILAFSGLKKLETIADLVQCQNLKELRIEDSNIPDDIEKITQIKSLEKLVVDYGQDVAEKYPKIKHLIFHD